MAGLTEPETVAEAAEAVVEDASSACEGPSLSAAQASSLRPQLMSARAVADLAETFRLLGDSTRVRILDALSHGEMCVCDLAALLGVSSSAVSHQLRLLRNVRMVRYRRAGRMTYYTLDDDHVVSLFGEALKHVQERA